MFKIGEVVTINSESHGWGTVESGDQAIVRTIGIDTLLVDIPSKNVRDWRGTYNCFSKDSKNNAINYILKNRSCTGIHLIDNESIESFKLLNKK